MNHPFSMPAKNAWRAFRRTFDIGFGSPGGLTVQRGSLRHLDWILRLGVLLDVMSWVLIQLQYVVQVKPSLVYQFTCSVCFTSTSEFADARYTHPRGANLEVNYVCNKENRLLVNCYVYRLSWPQKASINRIKQLQRLYSYVWQWIWRWWAEKMII